MNEEGALGARKLDLTFLARQSPSLTQARAQTGWSQDGS